MTRSRRRLLCVTALVPIAALVCSCSHGLSPTRTVTRDPRTGVETTTSIVPEETKAQGRRYVGGSVQTVIHSPPERIVRLLDDREAWKQVLPRVEQVYESGRSGSEREWRVVHALAMFRGQYTLRVRSEPRGNNAYLIRFWIDTRFERDVDDGSGYLLIEPRNGGGSIVRYGVRIALYPGLLRALFETRIQSAALSVPGRIRNFVEQHPPSSPAEPAPSLSCQDQPHQ